MVNYLELPVGENSPDVVNAVIEIPADGVNKYEYDKELHVFKLDRNLYSPVHYPGDYGFIPSTLSEDGDPLDVLVLVDERTFCGCLSQVRPIGVLEMLDQGVLDEKILAVGEEQSALCGGFGLHADLPAYSAGRSRIFSRSTRILKASGWRSTAGTTRSMRRTG